MMSTTRTSIEALVAGLACAALTTTILAAAILLA